jgi:hypothetical protein
MKQQMSNLYKQLISRETWEKALYFARDKDPSDLKKEIKKDDILPIILSIVVYVGAIVILMYLFKALGSLFKK